MNFLIINPNDENSNYAEMLADNGQRLVIRGGLSRDPYGAQVLLQGAIGGVVHGEFDLRDEVMLFNGTEVECYNYLVQFANKHFDVSTVVQLSGTAKQKCECGGPRYVDYGEEVCPTCIEQAIAHEAGIPF